MPSREADMLGSDPCRHVQMEMFDMMFPDMFLTFSCSCLAILL